MESVAKHEATRPARCSFRAWSVTPPMCWSIQKLVADRIVRFAKTVGRENVIASTDCGLGGRVHPQIAWANSRLSLKARALLRSSYGLHERSQRREWIVTSGRVILASPTLRKATPMLEVSAGWPDEQDADLCAPEQGRCRKARKTEQFDTATNVLKRSVSCCAAADSECSRRCDH